MTLYDFIEKYIAKNTMIRLWKNIDSTSRMMLTDNAVMEWEALKIREISEAEVVCITDIVCERDKEAVNIVINTEYSREDIVSMFKEYENKRKEQRLYVSES